MRATGNGDALSGRRARGAASGRRSQPGVGASDPRPASGLQPGDACVPEPAATARFPGRPSAATSTPISSSPPSASVRKQIADAAVRDALRVTRDDVRCPCCGALPAPHVAHAPSLLRSCSLVRVDGRILEVRSTHTGEHARPPTPPPRHNLHSLEVPVVAAHAVSYPCSALHTQRARLL